MRWPRSSDSRRRSPRPGSSQSRDQLGQVRPVVQEPCRRRVKSGSFVQQLRLQRLDRKQRDQAHDRADLELDRPAVGQVQHVVVELSSSSHRPMPCSPPPMLVMASAMYRKCSKNLVAMSS